MSKWIVQVCLNEKGEAVSVKDYDGNEIKPLNSPGDDANTGRIKNMSPMALIEAEPAHKSVGSAATMRRCYWVYIGGKYYLICK